MNVERVFQFAHVPLSFPAFAVQLQNFMRCPVFPVQAGIPSKLVNDSQSALQYLQDFAAKHKAVIAERIPLVISDIEMPIIDGYTLGSVDVSLHWQP